MIRIILRYGLILYLLIAGLLLSAQTGNLPQLTAFFVKPELEAQVGDLVFDVVRINNNGDQPVRIKPVLNLPKGFDIYTTAFNDTIIPARDSLMLPFRLRISNRADASKRQKVKLVVFDQNSTPILEQVLYVKTATVHNWDIDIPKNSVTFSPHNNTAEFKVVVKNNGNTPELISLNIEPDKQLKLTGINGGPWIAEQTVYVGPNRDTVIRFQARYNSDENRTFDISKVNVNAVAGDKKVYRAVTIEKYSDQYDPFFIDYTLPHSVEAGVRIQDFATLQSYSPFISARGFSKFKNESTFRYYYSNYMLNKPGNIIRNSNYRFLYTRKNISTGIGNFGSQLGRNIYSRNALMLDYKSEVTRTSTLEGFASQDFMDPITSAAAGYKYNDGKYQFFGSAGFNSDRVRKINTSTIYAGAPVIPLFKSHSLGVMANFFREDYYYANPFFQQGVAWDIRYFGRIGSRFRFKLKNNFGSQNIPGYQRGLLGFEGSVIFKLNSPFNYFSSRIYNTRRKYQDYNLLGEETPEVFLQDAYANVLYNSNKNPDFTFYIGPSYEQYHSRRPSLRDFEYEVYKVKKYFVEFDAIILKNIHLNLQAGLRDIFYQGYTLINETKPVINLIADYNYRGYGVRINYNYGPLVNRGLYQFPKDLSYNGIILSPYIFHSYWKRRVNFQLYTNFTYRFDLNYAYANVFPMAEVYLARNWYMNLKGSYTWYRQKTNEYDLHNSIYYAEIGIKKKWGKSDFYNKEKNLRRLKVICFKDENSNGKKDANEKGIEMIKIHLQQLDDDNKPMTKAMHINLSLLTNDKGSVTFNRIPKGIYQLDVEALSELKEYFYVDENNNYIELTKNMTYFIAFQKANRIVGKMEVSKSKYSDVTLLDLSNIKVTAFNGQGNSYSSFTLKDGSFTIYAPGDTTYFIRLNDIFGKQYRILQNDIPKKVPDTTYRPVVFHVVERSRQVNFKKVNEQQGGSQTTKIKVLEGKIYENTDERVKKGEEPDFDMNNAMMKTLETAKHYVVFGRKPDLNETKQFTRSLRDNGVMAYYSYDPVSREYLIFTGGYDSSFEAQIEAQKAKKAGFNDVNTFFYK